MNHASTEQTPARHSHFDRINAQICLWRELKARDFFGTTCCRRHDLGPFVADFWLPEARTAIKLRNGFSEGKLGERRDERLQAWLKRHNVWLLRFDAVAILEERAAILQSICRLLEARLKVA